MQRINEAATPASAVEGELHSTMKGKSGVDLLKEILAILRAQSWFFQSLHWQVKGSDFYQLHLLYERIYDSIEDEIDSLAEKIVSYFGSNAVDKMDQIKRATAWLNQWQGENISTAIKSEKNLQSLLKYTYDTMNSRKELSLGLDDFLMSLASAHETNLYLLGQQSQ